MKLAELSEELNIVISDLSRLCPEVRILLFGSFADNTASESSDLDIAVILPDAVDLRAYRKEFYNQRTRIRQPVDFIFRNQSKFANLNSDNPVDDEIRSKGVEVYPQWNVVSNKK